ncbi:MAG: hypothetical protein LBN97_01010 [Oscillospiraceae bacterium]|nr:hypothetical protein [Oscillospiraceae bacterium]
MNTKFKQRTFLSVLKDYGLGFAVFVLVVVMILSILPGAAEANTGEQLRMLDNSIRKAVVVCYALEGRYPESIEYLIENYGIRVDNSKFIVGYSIFASNIMPDVDVRLREVRAGE